MRRLLLLGGLFLLTPALARSQTGSTAADVWAPYRFLAGTWTAEGHGEPGQGKGTFSFEFELQGKILVRRNRLDFSATPQRPAFTHEDLLIVYREGGATPERAIYFDSEGFAIRYQAAFSAGGRVLTFLSDASPQAPRQRLTYVNNPDGTLNVKFELAPAGKPDAWVTHVEGVARRVPGP